MSNYEDAWFAAMAQRRKTAQRRTAAETATKPVASSDKIVSPHPVACKRTRHFPSELEARCIALTMGAHNITVASCGCGAGWYYTNVPRSAVPIAKRDGDERSCYRKTRFVSAAEAERFIVRKALSLNYYACGACGHWHLTKNEHAAFKV